VIDSLLTAGAVASACVLALFAGRRLLLLVAAVLPRRLLASAAELPTLTLIVPARNEASVLDRVFTALSRLEYEEERLFTVLVDDGSDDGTAERLRAWAEGRPRTVALSLPRPSGKPRALNEGLAAAPPSELIAVCDADLRPVPEALRLLAEPFADETVGSTQGYRRPNNARSSPVSRYAAVETWVHQLVTSAGKDRLDLNPPTLGFGAYRRRALEEVGWFRVDAYGEDVDTAVALTRAGWRTRFVPDAVAGDHVAESWAHYWRQHLRWTDAMLDAGRRRERGRVPLARRIEALFLSAGYADRVALLAAAALAVAGYLPLWLPPAYLGIAGLEVVAAVTKAGAARHLPGFMLATATFFALDVVASLAAVVLHRWHGRLGWQPPRRAGLAREAEER
jgi:cellulose synthase/poly-beta-1,6-N-acetylglucosamine synthase-like glycosyltransferase